MAESGGIRAIPLQTELGWGQPGLLATPLRINGWANQENGPAELRRGEAIIHVGATFSWWGRQRPGAGSEICGVYTGQNSSWVHPAQLPLRKDVRKLCKHCPKGCGAWHGANARFFSSDVFFPHWVRGKQSVGSLYPSQVILILFLDSGGRSISLLLVWC